MDNIEENLAMIFGEEEAEAFRQERRLRTASVSSGPSLRDSDLSDLDDLDRYFLSDFIIYSVWQTFSCFLRCY